MRSVARGKMSMSSQETTSFHSHGAGNAISGILACGASNWSILTGTTASATGAVGGCTAEHFSMVDLNHGQGGNANHKRSGARDGVNR